MLYDPYVSLDPGAWLSLDEGERVEAVSAYHARAGDLAPSPESHAAFHVIVENIVAEGSCGAREKLQALMADGLDRHNAVHAIASACAAVCDEVLDLQLELTPAEAERLQAERIAALTIESWHALEGVQAEVPRELGDDAPDWLVALVERQILDDELAQSILSLGAERILAPLTELIEADLEHQHNGRAASHAVKLLGKLGDPRAIDILMRAAQSQQWSAEGALFALASMGPPVVDPVLQRLDALEPDDHDRLTWLEILGKLGVTDSRIFDRFVAAMPAFPSFVAGCFAEYGDKRGLIHIHRAFESYELIGEVSSDRDVLDFAEAIEELGGVLSHAESRKLEAYDRIRRGAFNEPARRVERPGPNKPCWCGSGKKYKRCHQREDEAALD